MRKAIEQYFITYEKFSDMGAGNVEFFNVTTIVPMGNIPVGSKFTGAFFGSGTCILALRDEMNKVHAFNIVPTLGEAISIDDFHKIADDEFEKHDASCDCHADGEADYDDFKSDDKAKLLN